MIKYFLAAWLLWALWPGDSHAADRPDLIGTDVGAYDVSTGLTWGDVTSSSLKCTTTGAACKSGWVFSRVLVVNTHATETLYVQFHAGASDATTNQIRIPAGASITLDVYGLKARTLSIKGSAGSTTGFVTAWIFPY